MDTTHSVTHISLCAGYGGIDLGLARAIRGLRTVAFSEIEAFACANLVAKMEQGLLDTAPIWTDLKTFPWSDFSGLMDILSGGFPCQPFSAAGKRAGDEDPRHLFPHILRGITECQPRFVFLENVEGIISAKLKGDGWRDPADTPVLLHVLRELERVGYRTTAGVFSSAEIGASHQRKRVFILAVGDGDGEGLEGCGRSRSFHVSSGRQAEGRHPIAPDISSQQRATLRPKSPGPDQWWWEPSRITHSHTRIANRHGSRLKEVREAAMGDTANLLGDGSDDHSRVSVEPRSLPQSGDPSGSAALANHQGDGWGEGRPEHGGQQGGFDATQCGEPDMGDPTEPRLEGSTGEGSTGEGSNGTGRPREVLTERCQRSTEPTLGRDSHGSPDWVDYTKLCQTMDSRIDELRLLGNGVDPDVVAKAFVTLYGRLMGAAPVGRLRGGALGSVDTALSRR